MCDRYYYILLFYYKNMAQVRKYSTGGETSPKLLKREGYGDYSVADIESQYAKNLNSILLTEL